MTLQSHIVPPSGAGGPENPPNTVEARLDAANTELARVRGELTTAQGALTTAQAEVTRLTAENGNLQAQFTAVTGTATAANAEVARLTGELARVNGDLATTRSSLTGANANIGRLESLCGVRGIDPKNAVPAATETTPMRTIAEWDLEMKAARKAGPEALAKCAKAFEKAVADKQIAHGTN
jgi:septal ring factor EnvC (AmiA/AmiB activator)